MPFILIKGHFCPGAGIPDGDSVRFRAKNLALWKKLEGRGAKLGTGTKTKETVQLRFEGIYAIEKRAAKPLSVEAKESMFKLIGFNEKRNPEPEGHVLSRMTDDKSGRPIAFVFAGTTNKADEAQIRLEPEMLRRSVNYQQARVGYAYPLYYNTLFASLRTEFTKAVAAARKAKRGYWPKDKTLSGVTVKGKVSLVTIPPVWPKLWRRLEECLRKRNSLVGFQAFLEEKNERVDILPLMEERGLQDVVEVRGDKIRLTVAPENLRVVGKAGQRKR